MAVASSVMMSMYSMVSSKIANYASWDPKLRFGDRTIGEPLPRVAVVVSPPASELVVAG